MAFRIMMTCCFVFGVLQLAWGLDSSSGLRLQGNQKAKAAPAHRHSVLAQTPQVQHELVICNAYTSPHAVEILRVRTQESLTSGNPLAYKQCKQFSLPLEEGDQIDFKAGGLDVGTFYATGLPKSSASLLLIPHRRSPHAVGMSFESHAFADLQSPQVAVIDAYRGKSDKQPGAISIIESLDPSADKADTPVEEELKFNSVVAVNPGNYQVSMTGSKGSSLALNAAGATKYVVMRLGVEGEAAQGGSYPQELIVFPNGAARIVSASVVMIIATTMLAFRGMI